MTTIGCKYGEVIDHRRQRFVQPCGEPAVGGVVELVPYDTRGSCETCGYDSEPIFHPLCAVHINEAKADGLADDEVVVTLAVTS